MNYLLQFGNALSFFLTFFFLRYNLLECTVHQGGRGREGYEHGEICNNFHVSLAAKLKFGTPQSRMLMFK